VLGRQPVVDGYHDRVSAHRMLAGGAVMGVEVADDEAAAMEIDDDRRGGAGIGWWPIDPDADGARGTLDVPVLDSEPGVQRPARQVAEPLARRVNTVVS
jgi:hypothetical protein